MGATPPPTINLFTCTLGEAQERGTTGLTLKRYHTVNQFIDYQARRNGDCPALAYPELGDDWSVQMFTFRQLRSISLHVAQYLDTAGNGNSPISFDTELQNQKCVGLLGRSTLDLLFTWLALMRKGVSVLLLAPQCTPEGIRHLCTALGVEIVLYDQYYSAEVAEAEAARPPTSTLFRKYPWQHPTATESLQSCIARGLYAQGDPGDQAIPLHPDHESRVPYYHHTSGTMSVFPKPIPQSHKGACLALPTFDGRGEVTFTTTPLYHGGIADCFRSWTSVSPICLYPGEFPNMTAETITRCFSAIELNYDLEGTYLRKRYFSSVPYVLKILCDTPAGLVFLQRMDIVGVGGAALSSELGHFLVDRGVNLASRFGSAECGFLLSSHRAYEIDKDWEYLRVNNSKIPLVFEATGDFDGKCELVVKSGWPHMGKKNREDGSLATSDLFEAHPVIPNAWKHVGRSDSQITLFTGKKFDPVLIEEAIVNSSALVREAFIFGNGMPYPGALIFRSETAALGRNEQIRDSLWLEMKVINRSGPEHARIPKDMLIILGHTEPLLSRTSKGTIMRGWTEKQYAKTIKNAYEGTSTDLIDVSDEEMGPHVMALIHDIIDHEPNPPLDYDTEFPARLIDSVQATRIRSFLQKQILGKYHTVQLPWNIVYNCGTVKNLTEYMINARSGFTSPQDDDTKEMNAMAEHYSSKLVSPSVEWPKALQPPGRGRVVVLTGATGALGSHILHQLRMDGGVTEIICLVRASNVTEARTRVFQGLEKRQLDHGANLDHRISYVPAQLDQADLGLSEERYSMLRQTVTDIIHVAWEVNFIHPLRYFKDSLEGVVNLINLSLSCDKLVHFVFCSSTASIAKLADEHSYVREQPPAGPDNAADVGYGKSKWVAEMICHKAQTSTAARISVVRIGQLTGDTEHGIWNESEAWPLMLSTVHQLGSLPTMDETLTWLPLDTAATAIIQITTSPEMDNTSPRMDRVQFFHVVNNSQETHWNDMLEWIQEFHEDPFRVVSLDEWLDELDGLEGNHPAKVLSNLWRNSVKASKQIDGQELKGYATEQVEKIAPIMCRIPPVNRELIGLIWGWITSKMVLSV
ncbi:hypothetical protein CJF30_00001052 [Rutstroemia sp. NJR-2017a BBW]|nr:hypothetical protein CJF30_00001052 [Rutstroemia sp. NJR-2017a BBW]